MKNQKITGTLVLGSVYRIDDTRMKIPVLILTFNRPEKLRVLIDTLRKIKPKKLYCAQDGPRRGNAADKQAAKEIGEVWKSIDWKCEIHFLIRKKNLGCQKGVSGAIDWLFEHEEQGIILEDDCIPHPSFFSYCTELLEKYKNDERVMHISGNNFQPNDTKDYRFSQYPHCWGWATWKRSWQHFDASMSEWPNLKKESWLSSKFSNPISRIFWTRMFDGVFTKKIDSWAIPWVFTIWAQSGHSILPNVNLVTNIGFGKDSTHTPDPTSPLANISTSRMSFPLNHPQNLIRDIRADSYDQLFVYEQRTPRQLLLRLRRMLIG